MLLRMDINHSKIKKKTLSPTNFLSQLIDIRYFSLFKSLFNFVKSIDSFYPFLFSLLINKILKSFLILFFFKFKTLEYSFRAVHYNFYRF